jgi:hypothetical protein
MAKDVNEKPVPEAKLINTGFRDSSTDEVNPNE